MLSTLKNLAILTVITLIGFNVHADTPVIQLTFLSSRQDIAQILNLQRKMEISKHPKELSAPPRAICFQANIDQFLPKDFTPIPVYGCIFSDQVAMNSSLLRAGIYVHTDMGMVTDAQLYNSKLMTTVGGHDFSGTELVKYMQQANISEVSIDEHKVYKAIESEFNGGIIKPIIDKNQANFIFFGVINSKRFKANLSHELLHAQYYNTPQIARVLSQVWDNEVSKTDKTLIVNCLREGGYDMNQQELLLREFYSYFLQYDATKYLDGIPVLKPMAPLAKVYAPKIKAALAKEHITVLTLS